MRPKRGGRIPACKGERLAAARRPVDGMPVSRNASAVPLIITHGYPGTFWEMLPSVPALVDPEGHRADASEAFHVIVPSLPGYGFSGEPLPDFTPDKIPAASSLRRRAGMRPRLPGLPPATRWRPMP